MKNYIQYELVETDHEKREIWIAALSEFGFDGFEELKTSITATALEGQVNEDEVQNWLKEEDITYARTLIPGQNWNALWESNFSPVVVDDFACVRAHFHEPNRQVKHDLLITPKMSFGTGHHATTRQMIKMMETLPVNGSSVFDFGTGTGVLAILAEKMGAIEVEAIDNDEWSITNAAENIMANHCQIINLYKADTPAMAAPADILFANINKHIILEYLPTLATKVKMGGYLLLSGLLIEDAEDIDKAAIPLGFEKINNSESGGWIALLYRQISAEC
jgi:ribosomal protein L11 methyltransferase